MHVDGMTHDERTIRARLGIPKDAERVLFFVESSHWDPQWLYTSDEYFKLRIRKTLDRALDALEREPERVYSIENVFFLRMYWERCPERRAKVRERMNEGRLRLSGSGITTPDTVLMETETLLRDYVLGQEWLREQGIRQEPRVAYLPDTFGYSPALPSVLNALGYHGLAYSRVDGSYFWGCDLRPKSEFPLPGSTAHLLMKELRSLDYVWRDAAGAEILAHAHAFGYSHGDLFAHRGFTRWMALPLAIRDTSERHVASQIDGFAAELGQVSRTPYLFCPIGFDFVDPIPTLTPLLARYNRERFPSTGTYVVNAGLDDYFVLLAERRSALPVLEHEPNPYFSGIYSARPMLKRRCRRAADMLVAAEKLAYVAGEDPRALKAELADAWLWTAVSNHHDFITGTSPDRVHDKEQIPRIERAAAEAREALRRIAARLPSPAGDAPPPNENGKNELHLREADDGIVIETPHLVAELDRRRGGALTLRDRATGRFLLEPGSMDLVTYRDVGGLWRMGHEYRGGSELTEIARASDAPTELAISRRENAVEVRWSSELAGDRITRILAFDTERPLLRLRIQGRLSSQRVLTCQLRTAPLEDHATMEVPGGVCQRAHFRRFNPTFWSFQRFVHLRERNGDRGLALLTDGASTVSFHPRGILETIALRHAPREMAFGFFPLLGFGDYSARGTEREDTIAEYAFTFTPHGDWLDNGLHRLARTAFDDAEGVAGALRERAEDLVSVEGGEALLSAMLPASEDEVTMRFLLPRRGAERLPALRIRLRDRPFEAAWLTDATGREIRPLSVEAGHAIVPRESAIVTVRAKLATAT